MEQRQAAGGGDLFLRAQARHISEASMLVY